MLSVADCPDVRLLGLSVALTPAGAPLTLRLTACDAPEVVLVLMVVLPEPPALIVIADGFADSEKSLGVAAIGRAGGRMQLLCALLNSSWTVYVWPLFIGPRLPCCAVQMSPISPLVLSYQASGGPLPLPARPTSASVIVSVSSWDMTEVVFWKSFPAPHPLTPTRSGSTV